MAPRLPASEFPNDNPELHDGLVWACPVPCAPALPTLRLRASGVAPGRVLGPSWEEPTAAPVAGAAEVEAPEAVVEVEARDTDIERQAHPAEANVERRGPEPEIEVHETAVAAAGELGIAGVESGAERQTERSAPGEDNAYRALLRALTAVALEHGASRAAANLPALFGEARLAVGAFDERALGELTARGILDASGRPTERFGAAALAWRAVLEGTSDDFGACGAIALDAFCAELLSAAAGFGSERREALRRALRARGVAAFGMLAAA